MKGISGMSSAIAAAMILSTGMMGNRPPLMEDSDERPRPKPAERFRTTAEASAERIRKAQDKRARKAEKLRNQGL